MTHEWMALIAIPVARTGISYASPQRPGICATRKGFHGVTYYAEIMLCHDSILTKPLMVRWDVRAREPE